MPEIYCVKADYEPVAGGSRWLAGSFVQVIKHKLTPQPLHLIATVRHWPKSPTVKQLAMSEKDAPSVNVDFVDLVCDIFDCLVVLVVTVQLLQFRDHLHPCERNVVLWSDAHDESASASVWRQQARDVCKTIDSSALVTLCDLPGDASRLHRDIDHFMNTMNERPPWHRHLREDLWLDACFVAVGAAGKRGDATSAVVQQKTYCSKKFVVDELLLVDYIVSFAMYSGDDGSLLPASSATTVGERLQHIAKDDDLMRKMMIQRFAHMFVCDDDAWSNKFGLPTLDDASSSDVAPHAADFTSNVWRKLFQYVLDKKASSRDEFADWRRTSRHGECAGLSRLPFE